MTVGNDPSSMSATGISDFSSLDSLTGIVTSEEYSGYLEELKGRLGHRTVQAVKADKTEKKLPEFEGTPPVHQKRMKFGWLRFAGRMVGRTRDKTEIFRHVVQGSCSPVPPTVICDADQDPRVDIFLSDEDLADYFKSEQPVHILPDAGRCLFDGQPKYQDIQQNDKRGTCYLLSALASYADSPMGNASLTSYIHGLEGDFAMVTLYDPATEQEVNVMVSTDRLTDQYGNDLYSCRSETGAQWSGIVEKAVHALKISRATRLEAMIKEASGQGLEHKTSFLEQKKRDIIGSRKGKGGNDNYLDHSTLSDALNFLPCIPEIPAQGTDYRQVRDRVQVICEDGLKDEDILATIKFNIDRGIPAVLGTRSDIGGKLQAFVTGTPTGHAVAVLGPASRKKGSAMPEGLLIYDPYGSALDGKDISVTPESGAAALPQSEDSFDSLGDLEDFTTLASPSTTQTKSAGRSVRFYSYQELHQYFSQVAIARGGFIRSVR